MEFVPYIHRIQYYETDQMGIVHHSNYIRWFEEARVDFLEQIGFGYRRMEETGIYSPVLAVSCEYKSMCRFGESVFILPLVERFLGAKLILTYRVLDKETRVLRAVGESRHCFLDDKGVPVVLSKKNPEIYAILSEKIGVEYTPD